ncbi:HigA family addiction module antitoxin [Clostridium sporogenes]|uniref:HigA family addiction module antitoxin n=1 Tax=Clostridium sporogenes TaxID=1509 RepID=UPI0013D2D2E1|nr:HigA family addiction module antitoxin [Clostridium sporogenes]NFD93379.1 HigA family addiction module antidote protein [Clostridium sporogenes]NFE45323.1 HigA family addiction module antidote protein [Clostridium sporogenes]NFF16879.1 HigA family addiction module antidote protein [Clostridium sporogenes]NFF74655.1 HigA family addiction module antidote protein [Clostridium sporogenes]NFF79304.1 HigA family addiction module antidote protein [Clostridium sporogenes]
MATKNKLIKPEKYIAPMPIPPGETIKDFLEELGMTQKELSKRMCLSEKHLSQIINGIAEISRDVAERLENIFGVKARFWINLENDYRDALGKVYSPNIEESEIDIAKQIPYSEIAKTGRLKITRKIEEKVLNLRNFFGVSNLDAIQNINVAYRKANICKENKYALLAWIRIAEIKSQNINTEKFSRKKVQQLIEEFRKLTMEEAEVFYPKLVSLCASAGIALVVSNHIKGTGVHGVTFLNSKRNKVVIQLSVRGKYADKFWFTFFHEISHILSSENSEFAYINCDDETEKKVDKMAANLLIPDNKYNEFLSEREYNNIIAIRKFANEIGIHPCIVIGRLKHDNKIPYNILTREAPKFKIN